VTQWPAAPTAGFLHGFQALAAEAFQRVMLAAERTVALG